MPDHDAFLDPALQDPLPSVPVAASGSIDDSLIQPDLDSASSAALPPVKDTHSTRGKTRKANHDAQVHPSVADAVTGLVSMKPQAEDGLSVAVPVAAPSFLEQENARLKAELAQARLTITRLQEEIANGRPKNPPKSEYTCAQLS